MKARWFVATVLLVVSCSQATPVANVQPTATPTSAVSTPAAPACTPSPSAYGLLLVGLELQVIDTCGKVKNSAQIRPGSVEFCGPGGQLANLPPPVSATSDRIYYRDGDTSIKYLTREGQTGVATTVPGTDYEVSSFSVSPDDKRIAVVTENTIDFNDLRLSIYVEDLQSGANHVDLFQAVIPKATGNTLWPMGWHDGKLVLADIQACGTAPGGISPVEWHVVDPTTGNRVVTITSLCDNVNPGILSRWPSPAGVACMDFLFRIELRDWSNSIFASMHQASNASSIQTGLSPSGKEFFTSNASPSYCEDVLATTCIREQSPSGTGWQQQAAGVACLFIDEDHLLAPNGVIERDGNLIAGSASGSCAGRFPGGL
jgi:hypothetical protein